MLLAAVPYVKCHSLFHCHEEISVFSRESVPWGVWAAFGGVFCWFIPRVPHLCPRLYASLHPRPWVFLSLIPPSFYHSSPGAQSTLFLHQGGGPGSVPKPLRSVPRCHLLHPCGWKTAGRTCVCSVLGLVTYPPSVWISDT